MGEKNLLLCQGYEGQVKPINLTTAIPHRLLVFGNGHLSSDGGGRMVGKGWPLAIYTLWLV